MDSDWCGTNPCGLCNEPFDLRDCAGGGPMETIWLSTTGFVTGDPTLKISYPFVSHPGVVVTCTAPGDLKWVSMGLLVPPNAKIENVIIAYEVSSPQSFISQIRLAEMTTPDHASVLHDDPTPLQSTSPTSYTSHVGGLATEGAVTLGLRLNFQNTSDEIRLGAVGVTFQLPAEHCVKSIAALKALAAGVVPCLTVLGYYAPGDGGGGSFYWDASATEPDNAGTIIAPASNPPTGRWKRLVEGPLSVKWFGAIGDGLTPDWAAIQNAITTATNALTGQGVVFLPAGTYVLNKTIAIPDGITIKGAGVSSVLTTPNNSGPSVLLQYVRGNANLSNFALEDFRVSTQVPVKIGIYIENGVRVRLKGLELVLKAADTVLCIVSSGCRNSYNVEIYDCFVTNPSGDGIRIDTMTGGVAGAAGVRIHHCDVSQNARWGIVAGVAPTTAYSVDGQYQERPQEVSIDSCVIEGSSLGGIWVSGVAFSLSNSHIEQIHTSSDYPVKITPKDPQNINSLSSLLEGCHIVGNSFQIQQQLNIASCIYISPISLPDAQQSRGLDIRGNVFGVTGTQTLVYLSNIRGASVGPNACYGGPAHPTRRRQVTMGPNVTGLVVLDEDDVFELG
jgi:hypothetical protein